MEFIQTTAAPLPGGHYSQAVVHGNLVFVAGQLPIYPGTGGHCRDDIDTQTRLVLDNLRAILQAAGSDLNQVLKTTIFIADIAHWPRINAVYAEYFGDHRPARSVVPVSTLHYGFGIELEAIAAIL